MFCIRSWASDPKWLSSVDPDRKTPFNLTVTCCRTVVPLPAGHVSQPALLPPLRPVPPVPLPTEGLPSEQLPHPAR